MLLGHAMIKALQNFEYFLSTSKGRGGRKVLKVPHEKFKKFKYSKCLLEL